MMNSKFVDPFELRIRKALDQVLPDSYDSIENFEKFPHKIGLSVLQILIEYACKSQNINSILLARDRIKKIPSKWLLEYLPEAAKDSICSEDEWEYRRLLELVDEAVPQLLQVYIEQGLLSDNDEVQEAAMDFRNK
ncbi:hypothetical protein [Paenibacillus dendritiformis]|uniref:hypothetical protein n=1 Tax=Paenibacillus dendritiformis TaxID=130049 RepID=UPI0020C3BE0C|nr:hypothetical protein [Paenibacillus dendritiformis]CAH8768854.1 hypothetical protein H7S4_001552 [Paenibacillus dendritiformis]